MLRLKDTKQTEAVRELMIRCFGGSTLDLDYQHKSTLRFKSKTLGASASNNTPSANIDRYISQSVTELLSRTVV